MSRDPALDRMIGLRIRLRREQLSLTQSDMGAKLSPAVSHAAVSDIERGKTQITLSLLRDLSSALECAPGMFLGINGAGLPQSVTASHRCPHCGHYLNITLAEAP